MLMLSSGCGIGRGARIESIVLTVRSTTKTSTKPSSTTARMSSATTIVGITTVTSTSLLWWWWGRSLSCWRRRGRSVYERIHAEIVKL